MGHDQQLGKGLLTYSFRCSWEACGGMYGYLGMSLTPHMCVHALIQLYAPVHLPINLYSPYIFMPPHTSVCLLHICYTSPHPICLYIPYVCMPPMSICPLCLSPMSICPLHLHAPKCPYNPQVHMPPYICMPPYVHVHAGVYI